MSNPKDGASEAAQAAPRRPHDWSRSLFAVVGLGLIGSGGVAGWIVNQNFFGPNREAADIANAKAEVELLGMLDPKIEEHTAAITELKKKLLASQTGAERSPVEELLGEHQRSLVRLKQMKRAVAGAFENPQETAAKDALEIIARQNERSVDRLPRDTDFEELRTALGTEMMSGSPPPEGYLTKLKKQMAVLAGKA